MKLLEIFNKRKTSAIKNIYEDVLKNEDKIKINLFGKEQVVNIISAGDNQFDEKGKYKKSKFELNKEEIECLRWFVENVDISNYIKEIIEYCNEEYSHYSDIKITEEDIENEVNITTIVIRIAEITQSNDGFVYPEISFLGDCECDEEHGICIGFRDKKFIGVNSQDWTFI